MGHGLLWIAGGASIFDGNWALLLLVTSTHPFAGCAGLLDGGGVPLAPGVWEYPVELQPKKQWPPTPLVFAAGGAALGFPIVSGAMGGLHVLGQKLSLSHSSEGGVCTGPFSA